MSQTGPENASECVVCIADAFADATHCLRCGKPYERSRWWQKFCRDECRIEYHLARRRQGPKGTVKSVRQLKGRVAVLVHFDAADARGLRLEPGQRIALSGLELYWNQSSRSPPK